MKFLIIIVQPFEIQTFIYPADKEEIPVLQELNKKIWNGCDGISNLPINLTALASHLCKESEHYPEVESGSIHRGGVCVFSIHS